jgi:hypothetical protein
MEKIGSSRKFDANKSPNYFDKYINMRQSCKNNHSAQFIMFIKKMSPLRIYL